MRYKMVYLMALWLMLSACGSDVERRVNTGNAALDEGKYNNALRAYQDAQVVAPDQPAAYFNAASAYVGAGEYEMAIAALDQAIESGEPQIAAKAYYNLGNILYTSGDYGAAIAAYQQALIRDSSDDDARHNLELALLQATPTAQEQQTDPENNAANPEATPTQQPNDFNGPTPTPTPPPFDFDLTATSSAGQENTDNPGGTLTPQPDGAMTIEQAMQLLDQIQQDQQALSEFLERPGSPGEATEPDW